MKQCFVEKRFSDAHMEIIDRANDIIDEYSAEGFDLTLRQLYYQFVSRLGRDFENSQQSYKRLGKIIGDARMAGLIDWSALEDRTRYLRGNSHWDSASEIVRACASSFRYDLWADQIEHVEVWIEKDALIGVLSSVCRRWDVNYFSCRGYVSLSEMYRAARRSYSGSRTTIIHLGDHDPSGIDMSRDILDRIEAMDGVARLHRIALNMDQVEEHNPPPNPAKITDSRAADYIRNYGPDSWELDALDPRTIERLVEEEILRHLDLDLFEEAKARQQEARDQIQEIADGME